MITYELTIKRLEYEPSLNGLSNVITHVVYECVGKNDENNMQFTQMGRCPVEDDGTFIDYDNLTETIVKGWVEKSETYVRTKMILNHKLDPTKPVVDNTITTSPTRKIDTVLPWNKQQ